MEQIVLIRNIEINIHMVFWSKYNLAKGSHYYRLLKAVGRNEGQGIDLTINIHGSFNAYNPKAIDTPFIRLLTKMVRLDSLTFQLTQEYQGYSGPEGFHKGLESRFKHQDPEIRNHMGRALEAIFEPVFGAAQRFAWDEYLTGWVGSGGVLHNGHASRMWSVTKWRPEQSSLSGDSSRVG